MDTLGLIGRYIAEIGKDLPRKNRHDIEAEILSALEDMLRERSQKTGNTVDEQMIVEVLKEFGPPRKVAASYQPDRYVIEPHLLQGFLTIIKVILPIVAAITLVRLGVSLGQVELTYDNVFEVVFLGFADFLGMAFSALGSILVLFVIIQRFLPEFESKEQDWDPRDLPQVTTRNRVEFGSTILEVFAASLGIVIFNFFPQVISIGYNAGGAWTIGFVAIAFRKAMITTILSDTFFGYLPTLTILWGLLILLDVVLLRRGRWEIWSRWVSLSIRVASITMAVVMLAGPALVAIDSGWLIAAGFPDVLAARLLTNFFQQGTVAILVLTIIWNLVAATRLLVRLTGRNLSPALEKFSHP